MFGNHPNCVGPEFDDLVFFFYEKRTIEHGIYGQQQFFWRIPFLMVTFLMVAWFRSSLWIIIFLLFLALSLCLKTFSMSNIYHQRKSVIVCFSLDYVNIAHLEFWKQLLHPQATKEKKSPTNPKLKILSFVCVWVCVFLGGSPLSIFVFPNTVHWFCLWIKRP